MNYASNFKDLSWLVLKPDHERRPLWVLPDNMILLEAFSPAYRIATEFLIAIAEARMRPALIHEFEINSSSLYSAISLQYKTDDILTILEKLSKNKIPDQVKNFIKDHTVHYGKAQCVLEENHYYIECKDEDLFNRICKLPSVQRSYDNAMRKGTSLTYIEKKQQLDDEEDIDTIIHKDRDEMTVFMENCFSTENRPELGEVKTIYRLEIVGAHYRNIKEECLNKGIPLREEYEYNISNETNPALDIKIRPETKIRLYQSKALSKMFSGKRAQNGIIVLPCGAGKSLVGVLATANVKKRTIVLCNSNYSVTQWASQFLVFTDINKERVITINSQKKDENILKKLSHKNPVVLVTTYQMLFKRARPGTFDDTPTTSLSLSDIIRDRIRELEWGLIVLDEVHVAPADSFSKSISEIKSHCKLGLTATLLREDKRLANLEYLIGPKLHEENWKDLENEGFLAKALCIEVRCEMTKEFMEAYRKVYDKKRKRKIYLGNPEKFIALQYLLAYHEERGDKILVYFYDTDLLKIYSKKLKKKKILGQTREEKRSKYFERFRSDETFNVIFITSVGDTSIDLPDANVVIEISAQYGSRRQFTQRFGRILRPKPDVKERFNAFFYSVVSLETEDAYLTHKRQTFLINQGYVFKIIASEVLKEMRYFGGSNKRLIMGTIEEQKKHLEEILRNAGGGER